MDITINIDPSYEYDCSLLRKSKGFTPLMWLAKNANICSNFLTLAKKILEQHPEEINKCNEIGWTPLMLAARNASTTSNIEMVKLLLEYGADANIQNKDGWTALMLSASHSKTDSSIECVRLLLDHDADANIQDNNGWTALNFANSYGSQETANLLKKYTKNTGWFSGLSNMIGSMLYDYEPVPDKKED